MMTRPVLVCGVAVGILALVACSSSDVTDGPSRLPDAGMHDSSAGFDATTEWPAPSPPTPRTPCGQNTCWLNAPVLSGACGNSKVDEDFSTGLYNVHRYPLSAQAGLSVELTLEVTGGAWSPALLVMAADGTTLYDGEVALIGGSVSILALASGKGSGAAKLSVTALADTPLDVFVTSWGVIEGDFTPARAADGKYTLSKSASCPPGDATCPIAPDQITAFDSGYFTKADSDVPGTPNYSPYKRDDRDEHSGYDIAAPVGTPVVATESGTIVSAMTAPPSTDLCGKSVNLAADSGVTFRYCHLDSVLVTSGAVQLGQQLGTVGKTGNANYSHLHFIYMDAPNVKGIGSLAQKSIKVNSYVDSLCQ